MKATDDNRIDEAISNLEVPHVQLPTREAQLRRGLMALSRQSQSHHRLNEVTVMRTRSKILGSLAAATAAAGIFVVLAIGVGGAPAPATLVTFQVNPAFTLAVDEKGEVVDIEAQNAGAEAMFATTDLDGMDLNTALGEVVAKLEKSGYLTTENRISVAVHPAEGADDEGLAAIHDQVEEVLEAAVEDLEKPTDVVVVSVTAEDYVYMEDNGLLPGDYANILADGGTIETIRRIVALQESFGPDGELAADKFGTVVEAANEMVYVGIPQKEALSLIEQAVAAGMDLENVSELADCYEELVDVGFAGADAVALLRSSIKAGLGTDDIWDMADVYLELVRNGMTGADARDYIGRESAVGWDADRADEYIDEVEARADAAEEAAGDARDAAGDARDAAGDAAGDARDAAGDARDAAGDAAGDARDAAGDE